MGQTQSRLPEGPIHKYQVYAKYKHMATVLDHLQEKATGKSIILEGTLYNVDGLPRLDFNPKADLKAIKRLFQKVLDQIEAFRKSLGFSLESKLKELAEDGVDMTEAELTALDQLYARKMPEIEPIDKLLYGAVCKYVVAHYIR